MQFRCRRCGFCCRLDVDLDEEDIRRISKAGYKDFVSKRKYGKILKKEKGYCVFYKDGCTIYPIRPDVCCRFPILKSGRISGKCRQNKRFANRVDRSIIRFIGNGEKPHLKKS